MFRRSAAPAIGALTALLTLSVLPPPASAQDADAAVAAFYRGKTVTLVVGYGPGGGYDICARLVGRHIGRYIPGHPAVVVQNMPGAGSLRAVNWLYNTASRDGTAFAHFSRNIPLLGMLGTRASIQFDAQRLNWLGSSSSFANDATILIVRNDGATTIADVLRPGGDALVLGGTAEAAAGNDVPIILRDTIGLNLKQMVGFPDSGALYLAMERGAVQGRIVDLSSVRTAKPDWLKPDSSFHVLVQYGRATRHHDLADVPTARELARNDAARTLIELAELPYRLSRPFAAPPGVPADRALALQRAFAATLQGPEYLADAHRQGVDVSPVTGGEVMQALRSLQNAPQAQLDYLRRLFAESKS